MYKIPAYLTTCLLIIICLLSHLHAALFQSPMSVARSEHFRLSGLDPEERWAKSLLAMAEETWHYQEKFYPSSPPDSIHLIWIDKSSEFHKRIPRQEFNTLAVASSETPTIIFNGPRVNQQSLQNIRKTFIHEMTHIYINHNVPSRIPLWLNEGLAMRLANEQDRQPTLFMAFRNVFGLLPTLGELEQNFPAGERARLEAYTISWLAVSLLTRRYPGGLEGLLRQLEQPHAGEQYFRNDVWRPIDEEYRRACFSSLQLFALAAGSQFFWLLASLLFIVAYLVKRRRSRIKREHLDDDVVEEYLDYFDYTEEP